MKPAVDIAKSLLADLQLISDQPASFEAQGSTIPYLKWMCEQIVAHTEWETDKSHRWLGYIQGTMVARGLSTLEAERDRVREISEQPVEHKIE